MNIKIKKEWIGMAILIVALCLVILVRGVPEIEVEVPDVPEVTTIQVYIHGEVLRPGVYEVEAGDRLEKVLQMAGGFTQAADTAYVNLARPLKDGEMITVHPVREEVVFQGLDRFNYGSKDDIMSVAGIGETLASRIIAYREANGFYQDFVDLLAVEGIGESKLKSIEEALGQ